MGANHTAIGLCSIDGSIGDHHSDPYAIPNPADGNLKGRRPASRSWACTHNPTRAACGQDRNQAHEGAEGQDTTVVVHGL